MAPKQCRQNYAERSSQRHGWRAEAFEGPTEEVALAAVGKRSRGFGLERCSVGASRATTHSISTYIEAGHRPASRWKIVVPYLRKYCSATIASASVRPIADRA
jgi:hypothetical protein